MRDDAWLRGVALVVYLLVFWGREGDGMDECIPFSCCVDVLACSKYVYIP